MCLTVSTMKNAVVPGSYDMTLSKLLQANGLPNLSMGDISPPTMRPLVQLKYDSARDVCGGSSVSESIHVDDQEYFNRSNDSDLAQAESRKMKTTKCDTENPLYIRVADGGIQEYHTLGKARSKESLSSSTNEKLTGRITDPYMNGNNFAQYAGVQ